MFSELTRKVCPLQGTPTLTVTLTLLVVVPFHSRWGRGRKVAALGAVLCWCVLSAVRQGSKASLLPKHSLMTSDARF